MEEKSLTHEVQGQKLHQKLCKQGKGEYNIWNFSWYWNPDQKDSERINFSWLNHQICGILLWHSHHTNTFPLPLNLFNSFSQETDNCTQEHLQDLLESIYTVEIKGYHKFISWKKHSTFKIAGISALSDFFYGLLSLALSKVIPAMDIQMLSSTLLW